MQWVSKNKGEIKVGKFLYVQKILRGGGELVRKQIWNSNFKIASVRSWITRSLELKGNSQLICKKLYELFAGKTISSLCVKGSPTSFQLFLRSLNIPKAIYFEISSNAIDCWTREILTSDFFNIYVSSFQLKAKHCCWQTSKINGFLINFPIIASALSIVD